MISLITGKIGGGKTLLSTTQILRLLSEGCMVMTNIRLNFKACDLYVRKHHGKFIRPCQIVYHDFEKMPAFFDSKDFRRGNSLRKVYVYVDEAQLYFPSASASSSKYKEIVDFLTLSRRCDVDVIFITQELTTLFSGIRNQALFYYYCLDMREQTIAFFGKVSALGLRWTKKDHKTGVVNGKGVTKISKDLFACFDTRQSYSSSHSALMARTRIFEPVNTSVPFLDLDVVRKKASGFVSLLRRLGILKPLV